MKGVVLSMPAPPRAEPRLASKGWDDKLSWSRPDSSANKQQEKGFGSGSFFHNVDYSALHSGQVTQASRQAPIPRSLILLRLKVEEIHYFVLLKDYSELSTKLSCE